MLYPQNGSMAQGSRRSWPTAPAAAAVVSAPMIEPRNTPRRHVQGATPKKPASGLMAHSRPSSPNFIQQMSSPPVSTFHPGRVGSTMARFVFPEADGNAPAMYLHSPSGLVSLRMSM